VRRQLGFVCLLFLVACSKDGGSPSDVQSPGAQGTDVATVNGLPAKEFYAQFVYRIKGTCADTSRMASVYATSTYDIIGGAVVLEDLPNGHKLNAAGDLILDANGTYDLKYVEMEMDYNSPAGGISSWPVSEAKHQKGTWSVSGTKIQFSDLGEGVGMMINSRPSIEIHVKDFPLKPEMKGQIFAFKQTFSDFDLSGAKVTDRCKNQ
jgi:hypothetical protein